MTVLCLVGGKERQVQAELCFKEAISLGLKDTEILEEIGDLYIRSGDNMKFELAVSAFSKVIEIDP
jgi:tetratricopeptide (TPR) repeat protein